ncbi:MAG TPA: hypothetical protein VFW40_11005 [Capsulimonadaceae bacterium]|nr:hypothetical protein [Capsulimonadaceae bacterium]
MLWLGMSLFGPIAVLFSTFAGIATAIVAGMLLFSDNQRSEQKGAASHLMSSLPAWLILLVVGAYLRLFEDYVDIDKILLGEFNIFFTTQIPVAMAALWLFVVSMRTIMASSRDFLVSVFAASALIAASFGLCSLVLDWHWRL